MKRALLMAACMLAACTKVEEKCIEQSPVRPRITINENNIFDVPAGERQFQVGIESNIPVISGQGGGTSGCRFVSEGGNAASGSLYYSFSSAGNEGYTKDNCFVMEQSVWETKWYEYGNYGLVETYLDFRVRGQLGTRYINPGEPGLYEAGGSYYIKGELAFISERTYGHEPFESRVAYENYFKDWGYSPATGYDAEYVTLSISTPGGNARVPVYGKSRDGDIDRLLDYIHPGDIIEVPACFSTAEELLTGTFGKILSCQVLKIN